jgi:ABC-2 type transport system ATP-binding protein
MSAGRFVGRVGGLAVALGVGVLAYNGGAVATADAGSDGGASSAPSSGASQNTVRRGPANRPAAAASTRTTARPAAATKPAATQAVSAAAVAPASSSSSTDIPAVDTSADVALLAASREVSASASKVTSKAVTVNPTVVWGGTLGPDPAKGLPTAVTEPGVLVATVNGVSANDLPLAYVGVHKPDAGGKIGGGPLLPLSNFYGTNGGFTYLPDTKTLTTPGATEQFSVMALELTKIDQAVIKVFNLGQAAGLGSLLVPQLLAVIHRIPLVGTLMSPIIGHATTADFNVTPNTLANSRPTAFTYKMPSFDGTPISVNFFPAVNVSTGDAVDAPTVLAASGLACAANTDPTTRFGQLFPSNQFGSLTPGIAPLRSDSYTALSLGGPSYNGGGGYNVVTWDPRGEFASGGQLNIDNPMLEGRDTSAIISWLTSNTNPMAQYVANVAGDPKVGMTGGSYGGGIQLTTVDPRIDAILPEIGWNSLIGSLYPDGAFKTGWATILAAALAFTGARVNPAVYMGILQGDILGRLTPSSQAVLSSVGPTALLSKEQAPTMIFQGIHDTLFPLSQSVTNGQTIQTSPANPPLKLFWFCGGHGDCDIPSKPKEQDAQGVIQNLQWLDQYVAKSGTPADSIPNFQWYDQNGLYFNSNKLPWEAGFNDLPNYNVTNAKGGFLPLWPAGGGSGPYPRRDLPFSIVNAGKARNAVNVDITPPAGNQIVGSPTLSFTYSGLGTGHTVYAQLVDNETGLVLSNIVTPVQVQLDGKQHTATVSMEDIAYTAGNNASLTLQITSSSVNYANAWSYGGLKISGINLAMPQKTTVTPPPWTP